MLRDLPETCEATATLRLRLHKREKEHRENGTVSGWPSSLTSMHKV